MTEQTISLERLEETINVFGSFDENIRMIEHEMGVTVISRDSMLKVTGEDPEQVMYAVRAIENLMTLSSKGEAINEQSVRYIIQLVREGKDGEIHHLAGDVLCVTAKGKPIKAKTIGQKKYVEAIRDNIVTLGIGPAGTGKTYLAVAMAVLAFKNKEVDKTQKMGVDQGITSFVIPTGYTFNLDGSAIYQSLAALFLAQAYGLHLSWAHQFTLLLVLMVTSKGMAGVPGASFVVLLASVSTIGVPVAGLTFIAGIDRFVDMGRTAVNVVGNSIATLVIGESEHALDREQYEHYLAHYYEAKG